MKRGTFAIVAVVAVVAPLGTVSQIGRAHV